MLIIVLVYAAFKGPHELEVILRNFLLSDICPICRCCGEVAWDHRLYSVIDALCLLVSRGALSNYTPT